MSERTRRLLRRGVVYGVAGGLSAGEALVSAVRGVASEAEHVASSAAAKAGGVVDEARDARRAGTRQRAGARRTAASRTKQTRARTRAAAKTEQAPSEEELLERAQKMGIEVRENMSHEDLLEALRARR